MIFLKNIEVIDLFAGAGGLSEGFSGFNTRKKHPFKVKISIEKEKFAYQTLLLRNFFHQFDEVPYEYYSYVKGEMTREKLFVKYPSEFEAANEITWQAELGAKSYPHDKVMERIRKQIKYPSRSIVLGGPPCQAYSLIGRSKMKKNDGFENDHRHTLYEEYLKIIAEVKPAVFVMENVKGILSSKLNGEFVFEKILKDIKNPVRLIEPNRKRFFRNETYTVYSLISTKKSDELNRNDFIIESELYGIPQRRHRVILLAVRNDLKIIPGQLKPSKILTSVKDAISDLPPIRSRVSKAEDNLVSWQESIKTSFPKAKLLSKNDIGSEYLKFRVKPNNFKWFHDSKLDGVLNHMSRSHMKSDLQRYHFLSKAAEEKQKNISLRDFPTFLLPNHKNVEKSINSGSLFSDRFRVQLSNTPATTITSHIAKDGHYYIHYDSKQSRSLTVREAARIQTFPDNYFFEGPRTSQYLQVGNAVPAFLANQIASVVYDLFRDL
ncbi:MAG: DNA cytosine methyltransferase [Rhizobiales bacterium]|nr:DNA cytosine methyltransferase [Hyphomicrobiales bacterium]